MSQRETRRLKNVVVLGDVALASVGAFGMSIVHVESTPQSVETAPEATEAVDKKGGRFDTKELQLLSSFRKVFLTYEQAKINLNLFCYIL
jgi:hypothetical protein